MIRNERQYRTTLRQRQMLAEALDELTGRSISLPPSSSSPEPADRAAQIVELERASLLGQLADLDAQVREYEQLRAASLQPLVSLPSQIFPTRWYALASLPGCPSVTLPGGWE